MNRSNIFGFIASLILTLGCNSQNNPEGFDFGKIEDGFYQNSYFGFEIGIPDGWIVQSQEQRQNMMKVSKEIVAGDNENLKAVINASEINSANLLSVFQYEIGSPVDFNPNINIIVENIQLSPGIKNGSDYLYQVRKLMMQSNLKYDNIDKEFNKKK